MAGRRRQRELAVQLAYAMEITGDDFEDARFRFTAGEPKRQKFWGDFADQLMREWVTRREEIDQRLNGALQNWRLERLNAIDRAVMRLAVCEFMAFPDIPLRATINEFLEIAHAYGNDDSPAFVNGVLDNIARDFPQKDFEIVIEDEADEDEKDEE